MSTPPLVIAIHGTRVAEGQSVGRAFVARVQAMVPGVDVRDAYVELDTPTIADAVEAALDSHPGRPCIVVPLMLGVGGHVLDDIPQAIDEAGRRVPGATIVQTPHLGADPRLRAAVIERIAAAAPDWTPEEIGVVFLGRGCSVPDANADHARLTRLVGEQGGYDVTVPAYIQVVRPTLVDGLTQLYALGQRRIVVSPHYMFAGRLQHWATSQVATWTAEHPDAEVRLADVIGDCDALASVVVDRYGDATTPGAPVYVAGLDLTGRRVLVAGAGRVATRRIPALLDAGAAVTVVAEAASAEVRAWATAGRLTLLQRAASPADVGEAWYVLAATDDPDTNALIAAACEQRRIFCVRADHAEGGTARTPATGTVAGLSVAVIGDRDPRRSVRARDAAVAALARLADAPPQRRRSR